MSKREKNLLILLGVVALGALAIFLFTRGGEESTQEAAPTAPELNVPSGTVPEAGAPAVAGNPLSGPDFRLTSGGRDPFVPLVEPPEGVGEAGTSGAAVAPPPTEPPAESGGGVTEDQDEGLTVGGRHLVLVDVFQRRNGREFASVDVDQQSFLVTEGETFAGTYKLVSLQGECGKFLYGDESFTLCVGKGST